MDTGSANMDRTEKYYVIQVAPGEESRTEMLIEARVKEGLYHRCFHPLRHIKKKFHGKWKDCHEKLIPGYVFITSDCIEELYQELKCIPAMTKLLGYNEGKVFLALAEGEVEWLEKVTAGGTEVSLSQVTVTEGDTVTVLDGPLKDMEGCIKKLNLHKRIAEVEVEFMGRKILLHLGVELIGKNGDTSTS